VPCFVSAVLTGRSHSAPHLEINISLAFTFCVWGSETVTDVYSICDECVIVWSTLGGCSRASGRQETGRTVLSSKLYSPFTFIFVVSILGRGKRKTGFGCAK
jgi:hypothetical protein